MKFPKGATPRAYKDYHLWETKSACSYGVSKTPDVEIRSSLIVDLNISVNFDS